MFRGFSKSLRIPQTSSSQLSARRTFNSRESLGAWATRDQPEPEKPADVPPVLSKKEALLAEKRLERERLNVNLENYSKKSEKLMWEAEETECEEKKGLLYERAEELVKKEEETQRQIDALDNKILSLSEDEDCNDDGGDGDDDETGNADGHGGN